MNAGIVLMILGAIVTVGSMGVLEINSDSAILVQLLIAASGLLLLDTGYQLYKGAQQ